MEEEDEGLGNPVLPFQILSTAPNGTAGFYASLFDGTVDSNHALGYRRIDTGSDRGIQGGIWPAPPQATNFVQRVVSVEDVKGFVKKADQLGGKVIIPRTLLPEGDERAVLHGPQGMSFAVLQVRG